MGIDRPRRVQLSTPLEAPLSELCRIGIRANAGTLAATPATNKQMRAILKKFM
jgi:hypothetical protein